MSNRNTLIQQIDQEQTDAKQIPDFSPGDTVVVQVKVKDGERERLQAFEGVVIAKRNRGISSAFTVRKISHGVGVERTFQTYSEMIGEIEVKDNRSCVACHSHGSIHRHDADDFIAFVADATSRSIREWASR